MEGRLRQLKKGIANMSTRDAEPKLLFPALAGFYEFTSNLWYPLIRITAGVLLYPHVWPKLHHPAGVAAFMAKNGLAPAGLFAFLAIFLESVGATCITLGLFTRFFAAALAIEMAFITFIVMTPRGWEHMWPTLLWGIVFFAISLRGGGPYSVDRVIGKEL